MIVTIAGVPGSGKSTVANVLATKLGYNRYSVGKYYRQLATSRGMRLDQFNSAGEVDSEADALADAYQQNLGTSENDFVIDGRLSWHFIPQSFKVFLTVDPDEGARRIFQARKKGNGREMEKSYANVEEAQKTAHAREASDKKRYETYYGINPWDPAHYDLVIDTTNIPASEVARQIMAKLPHP